jgi:preprotein translocase subunit SecG
MAKMTAMFTGASKAFGRAIPPALVLATVGMLIAASSSFGQAAVEQYIPDVNPTGHQNGGGSGTGNGAGSSGSSTVAPSTASGGGSGTGSGGGNGGTGSAGKKAAAGAAVAGLSNLPPGGGGGSSSGGSAPGTDFPLTTFVFIVIGIFLAGLLVYVLLKRRRPRSSAAL